MNSLKNLLIIAVLAAVGYGVYASLQRNNADPGQPPGVAEGWPTVPKVEMPSAKTLVPPGGPLALGGSATRPAGGMTNGTGGNCPAVYAAIGSECCRIIAGHCLRHAAQQSGWAGDGDFAARRDVATGRCSAQPLPAARCDGRERGHA